jgi:DNA-binding beta-propeller fold protein YncE
MFLRLFRWLKDGASLLRCLTGAARLVPLLCCLVLLLLSSSIALADGGAPNLAYVAGGSKGISVVDVAKQGVTGSISVGGDPHMILLSLDGRFLYVTQPQLGRVAIIAASTGNTICTANVPGQPTLLALDTNSNTFFAAGNGSSSVLALDMSNCNVKRSYTVSGHVYGLAVAFVATSLPSGSNSQLWVADDTSLTIFDDSNGQQLGNVPIPGGPHYISIPPGSSVYTTTRDGNIVRVDLATHKITTLYSGGSFGPMDFDETTGQIYVPDQQNKQLVVLDPVNSGMPAPSEPSRLINLNAQPVSIAITNDGQLGFAALDGGDVAMLDIPARKVITIIHVGGTPRFIITGLYPPPLATTPQQTATLNIGLNIAAYVILTALLVVPIVLFMRYSRTQRKAASKQGAITGQTGAKTDKERTSREDAKP